MGINYSRPTPAQSAAFPTQPVAPALPQVVAGPPQQVGAWPARTDIDAAVAACPPDVRQELAGPCAQALALLRDHLPAAEEVRHVCSGAVNWTRSPTNSVFAVTSRRLLFVAPAPQVLTFDLTAVESTQCTGNIFHLTADGAKFQLGISQTHGDQFEQRTSYAVAVARLAHG
ncbi:hypothetical protein AB0J72_53110 [Dactylosporangium sp. NPDC049742]|uniref:hypothetical protein n=1 Tax=Dactylosporangium sp. NPDC049742 TaxID=3154737 RepID=UPI00343A536E